MLIGTYKIMGTDGEIINTILAHDRVSVDIALELLKIDKSKVIVILEAIS